jgi:hypothetical protein
LGEDGGVQLAIRTLDVTAESWKFSGIEGTVEMHRESYTLKYDIISLLL